MNKHFFKSLLLSSTFSLLTFGFTQAQTNNCNSMNSVGPVTNEDCYNTIITAVPFLRIAPDARGGAMGDAGVATSVDVNDNHYNIAKQVRLTCPD
jgi:hypothetical protein